MDVVARRAQTQSHKTCPSSNDLMQSVDRLMECQDEPFGSTGIFAQYCVFKLANENGIKVMLDGQGADEILGGYPAYGSRRLFSMLRRGRLLRALRHVKGARAAVGFGGWPFFQTTMMQMLPAGISWRLKKLGHRRGKLSMLNYGWFTERGIGRPCLPPRGGGCDRLRESLWFSTRVNGLPMLLRFEDRNSMAHSVESRVPFLTTSLVEFMLSLPEEYFIDDAGESKSIFREAMRGLTPDEVLDRRDKLGFETPQTTWLMQQGLAQWAGKLLNGDTARRIELLDLSVVRAAWQAAVAGKAACPAWMWPLLCFILWVEKRGVTFA